MDPYKTTVRDRLWAILEGYAPFTTAFSSARRLKKPSVDATIREIMQRAPQDFPQIGISNGRFTDSGFSQPKMTFQMEQAQTVDDVDDWLIQRKCEFTIIIRGADETINLDALEEHVQSALLLSGPRLGIPDIVLPPWGPITAIQKPVKVNEVVRNQSTMTLPVLMQFSGAALRTALST